MLRYTFACLVSSIEMDIDPSLVDDVSNVNRHLGWVQFSNGVSANTQKGLALEILMTMAPILDEGVPSLSPRLEGNQQVVPYEYIKALLGFQKGAP
jgi:hypothetical protein